MRGREWQHQVALPITMQLRLLISDAQCMGFKDPRIWGINRDAGVAGQPSFPVASPCSVHDCEGGTDLSQGPHTA